PTFLSPFDNLIWFRERVERVFKFRYRVEIYVPGPKREFGYYVLPLLVAGELVGRADLKLDRKGGILIVRALWIDRSRVEEASVALRSLAAHLSASAVSIERVEPPDLLANIVAQLTGSSRHRAANVRAVFRPTKGV
ncbi:MAG TPA: crosslink repair DNA glycosylase YcaQ family protein, partial [Chloroflexota bacterium]|nr:crosslink repair DNA glycosylase YcaQ family protein [Chloroflexota bacterium]